MKKSLFWRTTHAARRGQDVKRSAAEVRLRIVRERPSQRQPTHKAETRAENAAESPSCSPRGLPIPNTFRIIKDRLKPAT